MAIRLQLGTAPELADAVAGAMKLLAGASRRIQQHPQLPLASAAWALLVPHLALWPLSGVLGALIDTRPAARRMWSGEDGLLFELLSNHPELVQLLLIGAAVTLFLYCPVSWLIDGAAARLLRPGQEIERFWSATFAQPHRMVTLGLLGLLLRGLLLAGVAAFIVASRLAVRPTFGAALQPIAGGLLIAVVGGALVELFIDCARVRSASRPEETFGAVLVHSGRLLWRRPAASALLALVGTVGFALPTMMYHMLAAERPALATWAFALLWVGRVVTVLSRATLSMGVLAASAELSVTE